MLISLSLHMILLMFEILVCDNLIYGRHFWLVCFSPIIFGSIASIRACVWSVKHDRSFELELFLAVNALQFISLPLKLDNFVNWNWEVVFVPMWIVVCLCLVSCIYNIIFCGIIMRTPEISMQQKKSALHNAIGNTCSVVPLLCFQVIIADKLDQTIKMNYIFVFSPLLLALLSLIILSFCAKGGNKWWFGIRKNFYQFILSFLPFLQEYGNISYRPESNQSNSYNAENGQTVPLDYDEDHLEERRGHKKINENFKPVVAINNIYSPD
ncbi:TMEM185A family protein [Megaselia abdita]